MSLRRKIALWLCPELVGHPGAQALSEGVRAIASQSRENIIHAGERIIPPADNKSLCEALKASQHASDAAWKAEMLEQLKALNVNLVKVTEGGNAMRCEVVNRVREH